MNYYQITTKQDFQFVSSLFKSKNTKFFETKKINIKQLKELTELPGRNDYILRINNKKTNFVNKFKQIGWFNIRQSINKKDGIFGIIIDRKFQNKGYGKQAINLIIKEAKKLGIKKLKLNVFEHNFKAIHLYKKTGFKLIRKEIIMHKNISN